MLLYFPLLTNYSVASFLTRKQRKLDLTGIGISNGVLITNRSGTDTTLETHLTFKHFASLGVYLLVFPRLIAVGRCLVSFPYEQLRTPSWTQNSVIRAKTAAGQL